MAAGQRRFAILTEAETTEGQRRLLVFEVSAVSDSARLPVPRAEVALPPALQSASLEGLALFMGRDDWPRISVIPSPTPRSATYYRYLPAKGWESPADEQGALAAPGLVSGYYGVLGHEAPEVLCVPDVGFGEKRTRGWAKHTHTGVGVWRVALTSRDETHRDAWAWSLGSTTRLRRLERGCFPASLPGPESALLELAAWSGAYIALTPTRVLLAEPASVHVAEPSWRQVTPVPDARAMLVGATGWLVLGTLDGSYKLNTPSETTLTAVLLQLADAATVSHVEVNALLSTSEHTSRCLTATSGGVFLLAAP